MGDSFCNFQERSVSYTYVLLVQSVASLAPLVCWPKVMTPVPAEPCWKLAQAEVSFLLDRVCFGRILNLQNGSLKNIAEASSWDSADCWCSEEFSLDAECIAWMKGMKIFLCL